MSRLVGDTLPEDVLAFFDGRDLERKVGAAYLLVSADPDGTPRPCMLSAGEVLAVDDRTLRVALWPGTRTSENLRRDTPVLFCYVGPGSVYYVRGRVRPLGPAAGSKLERFEVAVDSVESDMHAGMPVTSSITFAVQNADPADVAASWDEQIRSLRQD